ncbi:MAG: hypothetical protein HPY61_00855 [Methanotrichaceae archaeon]|nr:hypothetical protein [Methanotrichaceae archaeon]
MNGVGGLHGDGGQGPPRRDVKTASLVGLNVLMRKAAIKMFESVYEGLRVQRILGFHKLTDLNLN